MKIYPQNSTDIQNQQPILLPNSINTQSFQPIQPQNPMTMHSYQPTQMQNEIPLPYYQQQHEITKNQLKIFSQIPNAAESLQMTMNPYLMGGSSITSNKPLMVFTGTDPEYSVEYSTITTTQQSFSPIHPNLTTPKNRNTAIPQVTLQSTVKPLVAPKYSHMDYQTYRPMTKPSKPRQTFTRSNFAEL